MKFLICGNYGAGNIGDEMILRGIIDLLRQIDQNAQITAMTANPQATIKQHQIKAVPKFPAGIRSLIRNNSQATKAAIADSDYFILGGGGLFGSLSFKANLIWGIQAWHAHRAKLPIIIYGQSIDKLSNPLVRLLVKKICNNSKLICVRDRKTKELLENLKLSQPVHLVPDPALNNHQESSQNTKLALLTLRNSPMTNQSLKKELIECLNSLIDQSWEIHYLNFKSPEDQEIFDEIAQQINDISRFKQGSIKDFQNAQLLIGMRLHSIITAINHNLPFVALSYAPKVKNILDDLNLEATIYQPGKLAAQIKSAQSPNVQKKIEKHKNEALETLRNFFQTFSN